MPKELPAVTIKGSPGNTVAIYFEADGKPVGTKEIGVTKARNRRTIALDGKYVDAPPPPNPPIGDEPTWITDLRARQKAHWDAVQVVQTVYAPDTIPHDGSAASSAAINSWLDKQASGPSDHEVIVYDFSRVGGTMVFNTPGSDASGFELRDKSHYILRLPPNGKIRDIDTTGSSERQHFLMGYSNTGWVDGQGCAIDSENPSTGTPANIDIGRSSAQFRAGMEWGRISGVRWLRQRGFGPWTSSSGMRSGILNPSDIWVHDCYIEGAQMGMAVVGGIRVLFEKNTLKDTMRIGFDIEPDAAADVVEDIAFVNNMVDGWGNDPNFSSWLASMCPTGTMLHPMKRVGVGNNVSARGPKDPKNGNQAGLGGLGIRADKLNPKSDFYIFGNRTDTTHTMDGATMRFDTVKGLWVTGNTQPGAGSRLVSDVHPSGTHVLAPNVTT